MPAPKPKDDELTRERIEATLTRFQAWLQRLRTDGGSTVTPATARLYAERTRHLLRWASTADPKPGQAVAFFEHYALEVKTREGEPQSPSSLRSMAYALRAFFSFLKRPLPEDAIVPPKNRLTKELDYMARDEVRRVLEMVDNRRDHALLSLLSYTGMRASEVAALKMRHFDAERRVIRIPTRGENGKAGAKGEKYREVVVHPAAVDSVMKYRATVGNAHPDQPLIKSFKTGTHLTAGQVTRICREWTEKALHRALSAHGFRRTFIIYAASDEGGKKPMPVKQLQAQVGHGSEAALWRYLVAAVGDRHESYDRSVEEF